jgi:hypothetical protein
MTSVENAFKNIPILDNEEDAPEHVERVEAFSAYQGYLPLLNLTQWNASAPQPLAANASAAARAEYDLKTAERRKINTQFYGAFMLSLDKVPDLRSRLKTREDVQGHPYNGAVLYDAFRKELFENPNVTIYENKLARIQSFDGSALSADETITQVDRLYAGLSRDATPVDKIKVLHLRRQLNKEFSILARDLQDRDPNISYADACRRIRAAEKNRPPSSSRSGEKESVNLATADSDADSATDLETVAFVGTSTKH